jgi:GH15 family glucan-1,4-alpha-glucosidase
LLPLPYFKVSGVDLYNNTIKTILENQSESGAYIASPDFPTYAYCWLRDGSFISFALNVVGQHSSARAYHLWVARVIKRYEGKIEILLEKKRRGQTISQQEFLHTRFTLDGEEASADWMNFQLDGYGTWLWALYEHIVLTNDIALLSDIKDSIVLTTRYLIAFWRIPNFDCWEEFPEAIHPYTLSAIYGGLQAIKKLNEHVDGLDLGKILDKTLKDIKEFILNYCIYEGYLTKMVTPIDKSDTIEFSRSTAVDASLLGVSVPYLLFPIDHPIMEETVSRIESDIYLEGGGVYRYLKDMYYGGGEWLLLACWLGWYYAKRNEYSKAQILLTWTSDQADADGFMPEQVSENLLEPDYLPGWERQRGKVAKPLLWSHAMYLILYEELKNQDEIH